MHCVCVLYALVMHCLTDMHFVCTLNARLMDFICTLYALLTSACAHKMHITCIHNAYERHTAFIQHSYNIHITSHENHQQLGNILHTILCILNTGSVMKGILSNSSIMRRSAKYLSWFLDRLIHLLDLICIINSIC